jgi:tetratricopeptide (TPR) repeat protein
MADLFVAIADKLFNDGRYEAFDLALEIAVLLRPEALEVLKGLGQKAVNLGEYQRAINILEAALQVDPSDRELQHFLSQMLEGLPKAAST